MLRVGLLVIAILSAAAAPLAAGERPRIVPLRAFFAVNRNLALQPRAATPVEQQIQLNYRAQLLAAQRELLQANPSGLSRAQIEIGHQLDMYNAAPH